MKCFRLVRLISPLALVAAPLLASAADLTLWYRQPAARWDEALPVGNGRLGAMVFGDTAREHLQLNESSVWSGQPGDYDRAGAKQFIPEIRRLLFAEKNAEAEALITRELLGARPLGSYQPLGDLWLDFPGAEKPTDYRRQLDLDEAIVRTTYRVGDATFTREVFASAPAQVIVVRLTCDRPNRISFSATLDRVEAADTIAAGSDALVLRGQADRGKPTAGVHFAARLRALTEGGTVSTQGAVLAVKNASAVTLLLSAATDYRGGEPITQSESSLASASTVAFPVLRAAHLEDHRRLFRRVALTLGSDSAGAQLPTDERWSRAQTDPLDPALLALRFHYGRYLLIASSRPGGLPANLQGIWNDRVNAPWFGGWHFDINTQMNYWSAETTNLAECHEPLFDFIDQLRVNGRKTAREVFGCRGFVVAHRTNAWGFTSPVQGFTVWPPGAAWLCDDLWEHYRFTGDRAFLAARAYPVMQEAAEFFLDWLVPDPRTGRLVSGPSISPENSFLPSPDAKARGTVMGPAMDQEIVAALFDHCLAAAQALGRDDDFVRAVRAARGRLAGPRIGADGRLLEWDQPRLEREPGHRHMSHLYALYPGDEISSAATPALAAAAEKSLAFRLSQGGTPQSHAVNISDSSNVGWSLAWNAALWARLGRGERAAASLGSLEKNATFSNLLDGHPQKDTPGVFQIDGNLGLTAAVAEMLIQSHGEAIALLPALPPGWTEGQVSGLRARGGYEIAVAWAHGQLTRAVLRATIDGACQLRTLGPITVALENGKTVRSQKAGEFFLTSFSALSSHSYIVQPSP